MWRYTGRKPGDGLCVGGYQRVSSFYCRMCLREWHDAFYIFGDPGTYYSCSGLKGDVCGEIALPEGMEEARSGYSSIGYSHGKLHAWYMVPYYYQLSVWVLEDYATGQWTLKHTADMSEMVGDDEVCTFVAVDSEGNLIFQINGRDEQLVSYDMEKRKFHVIFSFESYFTLRCDPYIPTYKEWLPKAAP